MAEERGRNNVWNLMGSLTCAVVVQQQRMRLSNHKHMSADALRRLGIADTP